VREIPSIQRIETHPQRIAVGRRQRTLPDEHRRGEQPHVSAGHR
jgi:hypothetical protein